MSFDFDDVHDSPRLESEPKRSSSRGPPPPPRGSRGSRSRPALGLLLDAAPQPESSASAAAPKSANVSSTGGSVGRRRGSEQVVRDATPTDAAGSSDTSSSRTGSGSGSVYGQASALYSAGTLEMVPSCSLQTVQWLSFVTRLVLNAALLGGIPYFVQHRGRTYDCGDKVLVMTLDILFWFNAVLLAVFVMVLILGAGFGCAMVFLLRELEGQQSNE